MGTEFFLKFLIGNLETLILGSAFVVVLLIIALVLLGLREPGPESVPVGGNSAELEGLMRKVLESAQFPRVPVVPVAPIVDEEASKSKSPEKVVIREVDNTAVEGLKAELLAAKTAVSEKNTLIAKLKSSLELAQSDQNKKALPGQQMQDKIKELEAKLSEYEIIEDDIADLTMYKEENVQLKNQIKELMKNGANQVATPVQAPQAAVQAKAAAAPAVAPDKAISDDVLEEFKRAVDQGAAPAAEPATEQTNDDLMAEFAAAVENQKATTAAPAAKVAPAPAPQVTPAKKPAKIAAPVPAALPEEIDGPVTHNIMEEFMSSIVEEEPPAEEVAAEEKGNPLLDAVTDTDKMVEELTSLEGTTQDGQANLDDIDTDKMLSEASELDKE